MKGDLSLVTFIIVVGAIFGLGLFFDHQKEMRKLEIIEQDHKKQPKDTTKPVSSGKTVLVYNH